MDPNERFTDDEIRLILARAAERQEQTGHGRALARTGLTLSDLEAVASEAGIDPEHVTAAARELQLRREQGLPAPVSSNPDELAHVRVFSGPVDDELWGHIVGELRSTFGVAGATSQFGRIREWATTTDKNDSGGRPAIRVRVEPDGEGTSITIRQSLKSMRQLPTVLGGIFGGFAVVFAVLIGLGAFEPGAAVLPAVFGGASILSWIGARLAYRGTLAKSEDQFRRVLDAAELVALKSGPAPTE
ncbi:MAG: hypothetical protein R3E10_17565 [Gemmatimonadota bacterium]